MIKVPLSLPAHPVSEGQAPRANIILPVSSPSRAHAPADKGQKFMCTQEVIFE